MTNSQPHDIISISNEREDKSNEHFLMELGDIVLKKENEKDKSFCDQNESFFDYHGIKKAVCGKIGIGYGGHFIPKRILVIQMI